MISFPEIKSKARRYQKAGAIFCLKTYKKYRGVYIADDTGLGKTLQALMIVSKIAKPGDAVLIICPSGLVPKWEEEIEKHLKPNRNYSINVIGYSSLIELDVLNYYTKDALKEVGLSKYKLVIYDEGHYIVNYDALRTQAVLGAPGLKHVTIDSVSKYSLWLSATPMPNRVGEIYTFLKSIKHKAILNMTFEEFVYRWAGEKPRFFNGKLTHRGVKEPDKLRELINDVMICRLMDQVEKEIPPFTRDTIPIHLPSKFKALDSRMLNILMHYPIDSEEFDVLTVIPEFTDFSTFRIQQGLFKIPTVLKYLKEITLKKYIVFTYHREVAEEYFKKLKVKNKILITGDTPVEKRFPILKKAEALNECVLVCTMGAVAESYDLNSFATSFYTEVDWRYKTHKQTEGRSRRFGQTRNTYFYYFLFGTGLEKYIYDTYNSKHRTVASIVPVTKYDKKGKAVKVTTEEVLKIAAGKKSLEIKRRN